MEKDRYRILVCDDDREIVDAIEIYLKQEGYQIIKAYDGIEALELLQREEVQLLILDVMMPRLDGIRTTLKVRERMRIPIIILSAKSEDADKIIGLNIGADDGLCVDDEKKEVTVDGEPVKLTPIEYNILLLLIQNAGRVFSIEQIYQQIWNERAVAADNTVAVHIRHIREKIEINPKEPRYLKVVWGIGYKVEAEKPPENGTK